MFWGKKPVENSAVRGYFHGDMLDDRDYMRQSSGRLHWSATTALLVSLVIAFVISMYILPANFVDRYLVLSLPGIRHGYIWELVTFQFLHAGWFHLLGNGLVIFFFGRAVETVLGQSRFWELYFASGIVGGLVQILLAWAFPIYFGGGGVVGASAGAVGLIAAFSVMYWLDRFTIYLFFLIPLAITGKILFWATAAIIVGCMLVPNSIVANAAHLGGLITGFCYIHWSVNLRDYLGRFQSVFGTRRRRGPQRAPSARFSRWSQSRPEQPGDIPSEEFISREVDPILDKISEHGIQSLTERERKILEAARSKMTKR